MAVVMVSSLIVGCGNDTKEVGGVPDEPTYSQTLDGDFRLTISVISTTLKRGQDIEITAVFENLSGETYQIEHGMPMILPFIVGHQLYAETRHEVATSRVLEKDEVINQITSRGSQLRRGKFELVATAVFSWLDDCPVEPDHKVYVNHRIVSNTIILTVN